MENTVCFLFKIFPNSGCSLQPLLSATYVTVSVCYYRLCNIFPVTLPVLTIFMGLGVFIW